MCAETKALLIHVQYVSFPSHVMSSDAEVSALELHAQPPTGMAHVEQVQVRA